MRLEGGRGAQFRGRRGEQTQRQQPAMRGTDGWIDDLCDPAQVSRGIKQRREASRRRRRGEAHRKENNTIRLPDASWLFV